MVVTEAYVVVEARTSGGGGEVTVEEATEAEGMTEGREEIVAI